MSLEYAPSSITLISGADLFVALVAAGVDRLGEPLPPRWWNHAKGGFEVAFVQADHLRPFARADSDPSSIHYPLQSFGVPMDAIGDNMDVQAFIFRTGDDGRPAPYLVFSRSHLGYFSGA